MVKGRKRKANQRRSKTGRIAYSAADRIVKGNIHAQAMQTIYGQDGCDAIGRAYQAGLLGIGSEAKNLLDTARRIANIYWQAYEVGGITSPIADRSYGSNTSICPEDARRREEWLNGCLTTINARGRAERRYFDQLVIDVHPDQGPAWLDRMVWVCRQNKDRKVRRILQSPDDLATLRIAIEALRAVST